MRTGAGVVRTTVGETYNGMGSAVRAPFRDFNLMREKAPAALLKARRAPYDTVGLTSCGAIAEEIATLDLALGPDLDTPRADEQRDRWQRGASLAADAAVEAARGAVDHFIPVRGVIREVSGARRAEKEAKIALLAGSVRRGFLKAVGMQQNCAWPAAPVDFVPRPPTVSVQTAQVQAAPAPRPILPDPVAAVTPPVAFTTATAQPVSPGRR